jgi:hypothetical protein
VTFHFFDYFVDIEINICHCVVHNDIENLSFFLSFFFVDYQQMDPVLLGETDNIKVNKYQLMLTAQQILSKITHSVDKMPLYSSSFHHSFHTSIN